MRIRQRNIKWVFWETSAKEKFNIQETFNIVINNISDKLIEALNDVKNENPNYNSSTKEIIDINKNN